MFLRKDELWVKIYNEQLHIGSVDSIDLYMERVALVLLYGRKERVDMESVDQRIQTIIDMQLPDGSWPLSKTKIYYDGGATTLSSPRSHTTALALMALHAYINNSW
jgi:hypothetical protein